MKRWQVIALVVAVVAVAAYVYYYRGFRPGGSHTSPTGGNAGENGGSGHPVQINWQMISRPDDGFKVDLPADPKEVQVQAYNEMGSTEPVKMLFSSPDSDTTYAVTWEDNPPVARVNDRVPDRTLDQARDGMLARTQTTLVSENRLSANGFPGRDIVARNGGGGLLEARLIFMNDRLYTLMALYPSMDARHEQDVVRFYNSFSALRVGPSLPEATPRS
jgi:hypothetical protein